MTDLPFNPDWAVHPGEVLEQIMEDDALTIEEVARLMEVDVSDVKRLLAGSDTRLNQSTADKLESATGFPAYCWINLENQYREDMVRLAAD